MINFLVQKGVITQEEAATLLADMAIQKQVDKEKQKEFNLVAEKFIKVSGYTQIRYQTLYESGKIDGFDVRRARLTLKGDITPHISYKLQQEFGGGSTKLIDADLGCEYNHHLKMNVGQFKIPFSQENLISSNKMDLINRSQVVEALVARGKDIIGNQNGRDIGIMMSGSLWHSSDQFIVDYTLGLFNGSGINLTDKDEQKDVSGRIAFHPLNGVTLGGAFYLGGFSSNLKKEYDRDRFNAELAYDYQKFSFRGEYISGQDGAFDKTAGKYKITKDNSTNKNGYYVQFGYYIVSKIFQTVVRYDSFDPDTKKSDDVSNVATIGINWTLNKWSKLQLNYEIKNEQGEKIDNDTVLAQMQVGF